MPARNAALSSGTVQMAILNSVETVRMVKQGFHVLARVADLLEIPLSGLGMSVAAAQTKRESFRAAVRAVLEAIQIIATQKQKTLPVIMKHLALNEDEAGYIDNAIHPGWVLDGKPTSNAMKLEFELDQKDMGLKELPKPEQSYDFSLLDEITKSSR